MCKYLFYLNYNYFLNSQVQGVAPCWGGQNIVELIPTRDDILGLDAPSMENYGGHRNGVVEGLVGHPPNNTRVNETSREGHHENGVTVLRLS